MPVNRREKVQEPIIEIIEVQPSAAMLDDIVNFYHNTMMNADLPMDHRLTAAHKLAELGKYGFNVDAVFATASTYVSKS